MQEVSVWLSVTLLTAGGMTFPLLPGTHGDSGCKGTGVDLLYRSSLLLSSDQAEPLPLDFSS